LTGQKGQKDRKDRKDRKERWRSGGGELTVMARLEHT